MEPQKHARYSNRLDPEETEKIVMEKESDEEPAPAAAAATATGPPSGIKRPAAPNINAESLPFSIFILFFQQIFQILLQETNRYFYQFMACQDVPCPSAQRHDIAIEKLYKFWH
jgi:hypothetical protein